MFNKRKLIRDAVIIVLIGVALFFFMRARQPGPVESHAGPHNVAAGGLPAGHGGDRPNISDGQPLAAIGERTLGKTWFDSYAARARQTLPSGISGEESEEFAQMQALVEGLLELIEDEAVEEFGIETSQASIAQMEERFSSQFASEEERDSFLRERNMTMERLERLWQSESVDRALRARVAEMTGVEPESEEAADAYSSWLQKRLADAEIVFYDSSLEELYHKYLELMSSPEAVQESVLEEEGVANSDSQPFQSHSD